jgi:mono/diheme cytochrome c family protein
MAIRIGVVLAMIPMGALALQTARDLAIPDNPLDGLRLFDGKGCVQCHSIGTGTSHVGPDLADNLFDGSFLDLGAALWNHVPGMSVSFEITGREWPILSEDETTGLLSFLYFIDYLGEPGDPQEGERVFREDAGCASCHVVGGGDRRSGPDLAGVSVFASPLYVAQETWNHGPVMLETMRQVGLEPPTFEERDLANLSAFIRQQSGRGLQDRLLLTPGNPNAGNRVFSSKGCIICHGADGRGGGGGPDLSQYPLRRSAEAIAGLMWNHSFAMRDAMTARGLDWPEFRNTELADLVAYLYFIPFFDQAGDPTRGETVYSEGPCDDCHSAGGVREGLSTASAPDLMSSSAAASPASLVTAMWNHAPVMRSAILQQGRPWPELTGEDLRDLRAYFLRGH